MTSLVHTIENKTITLTPNSSYKQKETVIDVALKWVGNSQEAIFRIGKIIELNAKLINEVLVSSGKPASDSLKGIAKGAAVMWHGTGPFRLPFLYKKASEEISKWRQEVSSPVDGGMSRRMSSLISSVCEAVSMTMVSLNMLFSSFVKTSPLCKPISLIGDLTTWTADFTNTSMSFDTLKQANKAVQGASGASSEFRQGLKEIQRRSLLAVVKEVCGATGATFGILGLAGFVVAPVPALSISLAGTLFAVWGKIYEESMEHKCDFFSEKNIAILKQE